MKVKVKKNCHGIPKKLAKEIIEEQHHISLRNKFLTCRFNYPRNSKSTKLDKALYQYQYGLKSQNK